MGNSKENFWGRENKVYFSEIWASLNQRADAKNSENAIRNQF